MGLFDQIVGALNNPEQKASTDQLGAVLSTVQQLASAQGTNSGTTQVAMSVVGSYVRSALQQKRATEGEGAVDALLRQFAGTGPNPAALQALFPQAQQQQLTQAVSQKTGMNANQVQGLLVTLVPVVLNLLTTGSKQNSNSAVSGNSVLSAFIDSNNDGEVDLGDALSLAGRFLNKG